jgi:hypothetical protein
MVAFQKINLLKIEEDLDKLDFDGQNCIDISFTFKGITPRNLIKKTEETVIKEQR